MNKKFKLRVQKTASSSYIAIIPMQIIKEQGINKGDIIEVEFIKAYEVEMKEKGGEDYEIGE